MADEFYGPRSRANARALLAAAESLGLDPGVVRTVLGGYKVPTEVAAIVHGVADIEEGVEYEPPVSEGDTEVVEEQEAKEVVEETKRPSQADSKADWLAYATAKGLDVTEDNTKAEIVKAVQDSEKEND